MFQKYPESQAVSGELTECTFKFAYAKAWPITFELVETVSGNQLPGIPRQARGGSPSWVPGTAAV
jgi:hypothetical protein